ncbi:Mth938-like domain-containing protein [Marichromatium sp. AB31]|uniref:Mth938-like domain-containing protein n=1 Tax=Marichromatium sp. AB31 TaxID=2483362 RepID=UPI001CC1ECC0|nr:Mth938-like domain-containing protein [Marichromatium sp. AB31]
MKFAQTEDADSNRVQGYGPEGTQIRERRYTHALLVSAERLDPDWGPARAEALTPEHIAALLEGDPQVIVIGTGARQVFPDPAVYREAIARGVGVEFMDTGAACRTFNILLAEDRRVVAGLLPY